MQQSSNRSKIPKTRLQAEQCDQRIVGEAYYKTTSGVQMCVMVALHFMHYNFARVHKTLRTTPAMAGGRPRLRLSLEAIAMLADGAFQTAKRGPYKKRTEA